MASQRTGRSDVAKRSHRRSSPQRHSGIAESERSRARRSQLLSLGRPVPAASRRRSARLHILFPEEEYERAWQREVYPPLVFVAVALPVVLLLVAMSRRRGSPAASSRLREQVDRIAQGEFQAICAAASGDDEIRALAGAVNRMAAMLAGL